MSHIDTESVIAPSNTKKQSQSGSKTREDTFSFFNRDELATDVYLKKYAVTKTDGTIDEWLPSDMWRRMAKAAASVEKDEVFWEEEFYRVLSDWKAVPQGSIMFALGNKYQKSSCSNCFVIPIHNDSLEGIFDAAKEMAKTYAYRGGVGIDLSPLRPAGALVSNAARTSTGAWSYMDFYSYVTRLIGQHGRRGALMLTIGDDHPDLCNFITSKLDLSKITGANISIRISDAFMKSVEEDTMWTMSFSTKHEKLTIQQKAREIWHLIVDCATKTAEPGILFWDTILRESPSDCYADVGFRTICTNPCSEIPLPAYDACTLLSMNLTKYTRNNFDTDAKFDFDEFKRDVCSAVRFLDNVKEIDLSLMPLDQQRDVARRGRRIGMGTNGLGDTLANLQLRYDSDEALQFVDKLYEFFAKTAYQASVDLAKEKGAFPVFNADKEKNNPFLKRIGFAGIPRRNIALLTCAPTGSLSCLCQTSSGVEPVFRNFYTRRRKITHNEAVNIPKSLLYKDQMGDYWQEYNVAHHNVQKYIDFKYGEKKNSHIFSMPNGIIRCEAETFTSDIETVEKIELPDYFVESDKINWLQRVRVQATMQKWIDHAISSTCNLPKGTDVETVKKVYEEAYRQGCKGFTVYVDGCRDGVLVTKEDKSKPNGIIKTDAPRRPKTLSADVHHIRVKGEEYFVLVGMMADEPYEVFAGKNGFISKECKVAEVTKIKRGHYKAQFDDGTLVEDLNSHITDEEAGITRLLSLSLRHGADIKHAVSVLERVPGDMQNFARCISRALKKHIPDGEGVTGQGCGQCNGENLVRQEGCVFCQDCGWSGCS